MPAYQLLSTPELPCLIVAGFVAHVHLHALECAARGPHLCSSTLLRLIKSRSNSVFTPVRTSGAVSWNRPHSSSQLGAGEFKGTAID